MFLMLMGQYFALRSVLKILLSKGLRRRKEEHLEGLILEVLLSLGEMIILWFAPTLTMLGLCSGIMVHSYTKDCSSTIFNPKPLKTCNLFFLVSIAKMKSIALLTNKLRKNNQPCLIYHRFGKCNAKEEGKCWRVHDPKNIAICRK